MSTAEYSMYTCSRQPTAQNAIFDYIHSSVKMSRSAMTFTRIPDALLSVHIAYLDKPEQGLKGAAPSRVRLT